MVRLCTKVGYVSKVFTNYVVIFWFKYLPYSSGGRQVRLFLPCYITFCCDCLASLIISYLYYLCIQSQFAIVPFKVKFPCKNDTYFILLTLILNWKLTRLCNKTKYHKFIGFRIATCQPHLFQIHGVDKIY